MPQPHSPYEHLQLQTNNSSHTPSQPIPLHPLINNIDGSGMLALELASLSGGLNAHVDIAKLTDFDPPNHLCTAQILIAFLTTAAETEQQNDDNRSIGQNYCIGTATDGPYRAVGIVACNHIIIVDASCTWLWK